MTTIRLFRRNSIRRKLCFLVILNAGFTFLLVGLLLFGYEKIETREVARRELSSQAGVVADSSAAALTFSDESAATDTLNALHANPGIVQAATYTRDGRLFAWYERGGPESGHPPARPRKDGTAFEDGNLLMSQAIRFGGQSIGTVFLKASMNEADLHLRRDMGFICLVLLFALALALLLSARTQRTITRPIADLSSVARIVSIGKDYSPRAVKYADDEIGFLVDSFNQMLDQIESREQALRESEERYAIAARGANDGLWDWKLPKNEIYFSPRWNQMLGYPETETWSDPEAWFSRIHASDLDRVKSEIAAHRANRTGELTTEYRIRQRSGAFVWVLTRGIAVRDADGTAVRMAGSQTDITQGKVADPLTGLPNRLYFVDRLESAIEAARRTGAPFAVLFLDMDRFKLVNDSMGHASGDELLGEVSERLRDSVRAARVAGDAGESSFAARLGGDEFAILLDRVGQPSEATRFAETIVRNLNDPYHINGRQVFVGVSIGVAPGSSGDSPEELLRNADTAMYHAKTAGKARFAMFDDGMRERAVARLEIETQLRKAIEQGEMVLHYQPQVSIGTRWLTGFEALVRWNHRERGLIPPGEFITVAEETELIVPLGRWVLRQACLQMAEWQARFAFDPPLTMAVNVSHKQLTGTGFVEDVRAVLAETGLRPTSLRLEMTESAVMKNPQDSIEKLGRLKELGLGLEIDDFGTGYSSLSYLSCLPFDTVKIDRSFVSELGVREDRGEIVRTILDLARSLNLDVIAEGVETEVQLQKLISLGCSRAQGFYFSKPVAANMAPLLFEVETLKRSFNRLEQQAEILNQPDSPEPAYSASPSVPEYVHFGPLTNKERETAIQPV